MTAKGDVLKPRTWREVPAYLVEDTPPYPDPEPGTDELYPFEDEALDLLDAIAGFRESLPRIEGHLERIAIHLGNITELAMLLATEPTAADPEAEDMSWLASPPNGQDYAPAERGQPVAEVGRPPGKVTERNRHKEAANANGRSFGGNGKVNRIANQNRRTSHRRRTGRWTRRYPPPLPGCGRPGAA